MNCEYENIYCAKLCIILGDDEHADFTSFEIYSLENKMTKIISEYCQHYWQFAGIFWACFFFFF